MKVVYRVHALQRMIERKISPEEISEVIERGQTLEVYETDNPYPSELKFKIVRGRAIHIVIASASDATYVITAYEPKPDQWDNTFKRRKQK